MCAVIVIGEQCLLEDGIVSHACWLQSVQQWTTEFMVSARGRYRTTRLLASSQHMYDPTACLSDVCCLTGVTTYCATPLKAKRITTLTATFVAVPSTRLPTDSRAGFGSAHRTLTRNGDRPLSIRLIQREETRRAARGKLESLRNSNGIGKENKECTQEPRDHFFPPPLSLPFSGSSRCSSRVTNVPSVPSYFCYLNKRTSGLPPPPTE
jgi:hypothetical protein